MQSVIRSASPVERSAAFTPLHRPNAHETRDYSVLLLS